MKNSEFLLECSNVRSKILSTMVLDKLAILFFRKLNPRKARILSSVLLFTFFEIIQIVIILSVKRPLLPVLSATFLDSFISSLSIYFISWGHLYFCEQLEIVNDQLPIGQYVSNGLLKWLKQWAKPWLQLVVSFCTSFLLIGFCCYIQFTKGLAYYLSDIFTFMFPFAFWLSQGFYWSIATPLMTSSLNQGMKIRARIMPVYINRTPILAFMSNMLISSSVAITVLITLSMFGLFMVRPNIIGNSFIYLFIILVMTYILSVWTFVYPQYRLSKVIKQVKRDTLLEIEKEIDKLFWKLNSFGKSDFLRISDLMELHKKVYDAPNSMISISVRWSYIGSLLPPTLVAILGSLDWVNLLTKILGFLNHK